MNKFFFFEKKRNFTIPGISNLVAQLLFDKANMNEFLEKNNENIKFEIIVKEEYI